MSAGSRRKFSERLAPEDVARYEATRYRGSQKIVNRRELAIVPELLALAANGRRDLAVLDVPCGFGRFTEALLAVATYLVDADRSDSMASRARTHALDLGAKRPGFSVCDIRALPFASGAFDVILSMRLLHHLHEKSDRAAMFTELWRVSRKHVVISFYDRTLLHRIQRALATITRKKRRSSKIYFFGMGPFRREAEAAGFRVLAVRAPLRGLHAQRVALLEKL